MKNIYLSIAAALVIGSTAKAQCTGRYTDNLYPITATTGIAYGSNITYTGSTQTLTLDFYEPTADTSHARPLIIWAHGGSFISGTSADADVDTLCHRFAKKGYACASINYRLGVSSFDSLGFIPAVIRGVQDMKAAVRFFYKDKQTTNTYKIDTNNIFIGGSSAGSFIALHYQYLDKVCEISPAYISASDLTALGGLDGTSGNAGYSQKVNGVIDLCGALGVYAWLEAGNLPLCSMHGTADGTVNYSRGEVLPPAHILYADGSCMIYKRAECVGVQDNFYTWLGAPHVPYAGSTATEIAYMDTTVNFVHDYLLQRLNRSCTPLQPADPAYGPVTLYTYTSTCDGTVQSNCTTGIEKNKANSLSVSVYPNPSNSDVTVSFTNANAVVYSVELTDISGRVVKSATTKEAAYTLERSTLTSGVYFLKVYNSQGESSVQKIIFY
jgi:alpha/beta superfamily hydrolase